MENDLFSKSPLTYGGKPPKHDCSLKARKAWFCFDDEIVCLGSAVSAEDGFEVLTVVENLPYEANVIDDKRFYISNTGLYMVLDDKTLTYDKGAFAAVINHGINPIMLPTRMRFCQTAMISRKILWLQRFW